MKSNSQPFVTSIKLLLKIQCLWFSGLVYSWVWFMREVGEKRKAILLGVQLHQDTVGLVGMEGMGAGRECAAVFCCPDLGAVLWNSSVLLLALQMPG